MTLRVFGRVVVEILNCTARVLSLLPTLVRIVACPLTIVTVIVFVSAHMQPRELLCVLHTAVSALHERHTSARKQWPLLSLHTHCNTTRVAPSFSCMQQSHTPTID